jgi:hypothetical protein
MKTLATIMLIVGAIGLGGVAFNRQADATPPEPIVVQPTFEAVHVYIDSGDVPLAAYQFELTSAQGAMQIVGVENGEHAAFGEPPFYDRKAVEGGQAERIIIAAFSTADAEQLPTGKTRVATVHLRTIGGAGVNIELRAAADAQGNKIQPTITFEKGNDR